MKKFGSILLVLLMAASLCACGAVKPEKNTEQTPPPAAAMTFTVDTETYEEEYKDSSGTVLATCRYEIPQLHALDADGTEVYALQTQESNAQTITDPLGIFQMEMARYLSEKQTFFHEMSAWAQQFYSDVAASGGELLWLGAYSDEMTVEQVYQSNTLVSIYATFYTNTGGAHPNGGFVTWNFDLATGEFLTYEDFTDQEERFRAAVANEILRQIAAAGMSEYYYDDYASYVRDLAYASVYFGEEGMMVSFEEYTMGPHAAGVPAFTVPYDVFARFLSARGRELLAPDQETMVLSDFHEAQELWNGFNMATFPLDYGSPAEADGYTYYRVNYGDIHSMAELRVLLLTRFDASIVDTLMEEQSTPYRDIGGVLYGADSGRGGDISRGEAAYTVELSGDGGTVAASVEEYDIEAAPDEQTGLFPVKGHLRFEFPFVLTEDGARFTKFESIW